MSRTDPVASAAKTALITGASSGIGATYADRLAKRGFNLVLVARDRARLEALAQRLRQESGVNVELLPADLSKPAELARVEARLRDDAAITLLVNNAGIAGGGAAVTADPAMLEGMIRLNVLAVVRLATAIAPRLAALGRGTIVNLASVTALMAEAFDPVYAASKAFVLAYSQGLDAELSQRGVAVQVVLPGITRTEIWERSGYDLAKLPAEMVMEVGELVDAALAGLDQGERITIPSLPDVAEWQDYEAQRLALRPRLSLRRAAARYGLS